MPVSGGDQPGEPVAQSGGDDAGDAVSRGRGGYRQSELNTIPTGISAVRATRDTSEQPIDVLSNFIPLAPMKEREPNQYRVDFSPELEAVSLRRQLFKELADERFDKNYTYDGMHDLMSVIKLPDEITIFTAPDPRDAGRQIKLTIKKVSLVNNPFKLIRVYNMNMKKFLRILGYFSVSQTGAYVHPAFSTQIGNNTGIAALRGYRTSANVHEDDQVLMNLESVHKLMQQKNVLQHMKEMRNLPNFKEAIVAQLTGKLVVTNYNKVVYKIEDVKFTLNPTSTFRDEKRNTDTAYIDYYQNRYAVRIQDTNQPLLRVVPNNVRRKGDEEPEKKEIYLVPELCNIAGLTDAQRNDNRLKVDLIRASQISPADRVKHLQMFLEKLHADPEVPKLLNRWGYQYDKEPVKIKARIMAKESVGVGSVGLLGADKWPKVDNMASFENHVMRDKLVVPPANFKKMAIIISKADAANENAILGKLKTGFGKVGLNPSDVNMIRIREGDSAHHYVQYIKNLPKDVDAALVILTRQNKERYDAVKKLATVERGLITQVVTSKLMMDDRKANGAAVKIGIQMAAKVGGEPWFIQIPLGPSMICGYDTYHDTTNRGRSYGAFLASMNKNYSRWYSKVDKHEHLDELSNHLAENLISSLRRFKEINNRLPERVFIYRDGVSDGQLAQVFASELKQVERAIKGVDERIRLAFIVVNKRIGARFYMANNQTYLNPPPGSVIDTVVTRKERYDFYLISQSTRNGTVTPTYYNIIYDDTGLRASKQQQLAYKLCFLYYNWTGTVRVPAPCQYAHKLAFLCGEHLHSVPNSALENNLHFL